jgi:intracellular sulfur oxidation DsrE/DsrF family protein
MKRSTLNFPKWALPLLAMTLLTLPVVSAKPFWSYPVIQGYGPVHIWPKVALRPNPHQTYRALFDVTKPGKTFLKLNPGLSHIARAVNTFVAAGVPLSHLRFLVIIHGPATPIALGARKFQAVFHHPNPNLRILRDLRRAGVRIYVCGNALGDMHYNPREVNPEITVALSALTTLVMIQDKGYALMRM